MTNEKSQSPCMTCNISSACEDGVCSKLYLWRKEQLKHLRRIDTMTEDDLAEFLFDRISEGGLCAACPMHAECDFYKDDAGCADNLAHYLLSPAEEL